MKRIQLNISEETYKRFCKVVEECNKGFKNGKVRQQDVLEWILSHGNYEISKIQASCVCVKTLLSNAKLQTKEDVDELMKNLKIAIPNLPSVKGGKDV